MLAALILIIAVTLYRVCYAWAGSPAAWSNFSPLAAVLLCSAAYLPRKYILLAGLGPMVLADLFLNAHYHVPLFDPGTLARYFCFGLILLLGYLVRKQQQYKVFFLFGGHRGGIDPLFCHHQYRHLGLHPRLRENVPWLVASLNGRCPGFPTHAALFPQFSFQRSFLHRPFCHHSSGL